MKWLVKQPLKIGGRLLNGVKILRNDLLTG